MIIKILSLLLVIPLAIGKTGPTHDKVIVCYISTWAVYRPGRGAYAIENFDANLCTHAIYAFAGLDVIQSAIKSLDPWQDLKDDYGKDGYERLTKLKKSYPHLKVLLAIGGWNEGSKNYSVLSADPERRKKFVKQVTEFIRKYNFDGLDLDWEFPTQRGGEMIDRENFVLLVKDLRTELDKYRLLLTSAIGASKKVMTEAYDVKQLTHYLDYLNIMCYDYHGSWERKVGANAPLEAEDGDELSVKFTIDYLIKNGASPSTLVMGVPFYGRTFKTVSEGDIGDIAEDFGFQGPYTREDGFLGYNEICQMIQNKTSNWTTSWDDSTSQAIARLPRIEAQDYVKVVTYDSTRSIANKVRFAVKYKLAGIMVWSVDTDDFRGDCQPDNDTYADYKSDKIHDHLILLKRANSNYPLLRTINEAIVLAAQDIEWEATDANNEIPDDPPVSGGYMLVAIGHFIALMFSTFLFSFY